MKKLYYRILTALTPPKEDDGYSTETVIIVAVLVAAAILVGTAVSEFVTAEAAKIGAE